MQEGAIGLMTAYEKYKKSKARFSTYATFWIKARILRLLSRFYSTIHVTYSAGAIYDKLLKKYGKSYKKRSGQLEVQTTDLIKEISTDYSNNKISHSDYIKFLGVLEARQPLGFTHLSIDSNGREHMNSNTFDSNNWIHSIGHQHTEISDDTLHPVAEKLQYIDNIEQILGQKSLLTKLLEELTVKEKQLVTMFYGLDGTKVANYGQIAKQINISKLQIKEMHNKIIKKLKDNLKEMVIEGTIEPSDLMGGNN